jgi:hypothetical protein
VQRREELAGLIHSELQRAGIATAAEIADALGVLTSEVLDAIREEDRRRLKLLVPRIDKYSDDAIIEGLRAMSERRARDEPGNGVTRRQVSTDYWDAHRDPEVLPSSVRVTQRFGTWNEACLAAGIPTRLQRSRSGPRARWTDEEVAGWVARFLDDPKGGGSYAAYSAWASSVPGAPSAQTVRNRLGNWNDARRRAVDVQPT